MCISIQMFGVSKIFEKYFVLTKAVIIWSKIQKNHMQSYHYNLK